jgi:hypothetical protein
MENRKVGLERWRRLRSEDRASPQYWHLEFDINSGFFLIDMEKALKLRRKHWPVYLAELVIIALWESWKSIHSDIKRMLTSIAFELLDGLTVKEAGHNSHCSIMSRDA